MDNNKPFNIPKKIVWASWKCVKRNAGTYGIDGQSIDAYEVNLKGNLYQLWNRMASGSYFPQPVRNVEIPKANGGIRVLSIPTVSDRIAQTAVKMILEPQIDPIFHQNSYGYRPGRSAHMAIAVTRERCWKYNWILEFDVKGMFDNIPHLLMLKALNHHTKERWILLYCERWLKAMSERELGKIVERTKGTAQGSVISPLLMNLFMHYAFDMWMQRTFPQNPWVRYADDGCIHCNSEREAQKVLRKLTERFAEVGLEIHSDKTHIVYCADSNRKGYSSYNSFDFLGYEFRQRHAKNKQGKLFGSFLPAISKKSLKRIRHKIKYQLRIRVRVDLTIEEIAKWLNPMIRGWINYYGAFYRTALVSIGRYLNDVLASWARRKYKKLWGKRYKSYAFIKRIFKQNPKLFSHWDMARP